MVTAFYNSETKEYVVLINEDKYVFDGYLTYKAFMEGVIAHAARQAKTKH